jgi:hypothetical protein
MSNSRRPDERFPAHVRPIVRLGDYSPRAKMAFLGDDTWKPARQSSGAGRAGERPYGRMTTGGGSAAS